jgi:ribosomal protein S18 acetylase RimI-like enzyme
MDFTLVYKKNTANEAELYEHLLLCDEYFFPRLSSRVHLHDYSRKLVSSAINFEAWQNNLLVGLVAVYVNSPDKQTAFVTNVSVLPTFVGQGIAMELMQQCIDYVQAQQYKELALEVSNGNQLAIRLYRKVGFSDMSEKDGYIAMHLSLV